MLLAYCSTHHHHHHYEESYLNHIFVAYKAYLFLHPEPKVPQETLPRLSLICLQEGGFCLQIGGTQKIYRLKYVKYVFMNVSTYICI